MGIKKPAGKKPANRKPLEHKAYNVPQKITFRSDGNVLEYLRMQSMDKPDKQGRWVKNPPRFWYKYTKSLTKLDMEMYLREEDIEYLIRRELIDYEK